ncbi:IclR family transcriptional regulator [Salinibacterium sp. ZJ70]|uniref:IclR family transcriptional regulator n=1 Tax=Salinibacterium sp. ZJ70 TaxID=2708084 RepID=UPI001421AC8F|nr:IclR family transcriptional regulator [Salinibacterium sp. ZJ70]
MARLTPAVMRTFDILELFVDGPAELTAAEIGARTGFPRTSIHELLATLVEREYLVRDPRTGGYRLGVKVLHLGNAYSAQFDLLGAASSAARALAERSGETVSVAVREGSDVLYLAKVEGRDTLRLPSSIGQRLPAHVTGLGKALLASLPRETVRALYPDPDSLPALTPRSIRTLDELERHLDETRDRGGVAFEVEESAADMRCVAAPVRAADASVAAAISISVPLARWAQHPDEHWIALATEAAGELSAQLGYRAR